jgi:hypothetical protein
VRAWLARTHGAPLLGVVPRLAPASIGSASVDSIATIASTHLDIEGLLTTLRAMAHPG